MPYTITESCVGVVDTSCVDVCPIDCIHPTKEEWAEKGYEEGNLGDKQLFVDPEECIDCGACEPVCPVQAIFPEDEVPDTLKDFIKKNHEYYGHDYSE